MIEVSEASVCTEDVIEISESTPIIGEEQYAYTEDELFLLSHLIYAEAGSNTCSDLEQLMVGSVVMNRMKLSGKSMYDVIYAKGQYACTWDGNFEKTPNQRAMNNAIQLFDNGKVLPDNVIFQSQKILGPIYAVEGNHYFCTK